MSESSQNGPLLPSELDGAAASVYFRALKVGEFRADDVREATGLPAETVARCRKELQDHCLLAPLPGDGDEDRLVPVNPEIAAAKLTAPIEDLIRSYRTSADAMRERLLQLMPAYLSAHTGSGISGVLEEVPDGRDVQLLVNRAVESCATEMMTVQPGGKRNPVILQDALPRDIAAAKRGVRVRMLYQHTARAALSGHAYISAMTEAGGEVRTVDQLPERMFIFDREMAFIPKRTRPDRVPGALIVRDAVIVSFLCTLFEQFWIGAMPFVPEGPGYHDASSDLRRSIVSLLAQGLKDEAVAKRLGMSVRTCRRHIASLMQELGAESRFEAGVKAAQLGLLRMDGAD